MAKKKVGAIIALDGGAKFREEVKACNKSLSTMKSELNLVKAESVGNANSLEALQKKHEVLNDILDTHVKKQEKVEEGLTHAKEEYKRVGSELDSYKNKLKAAQEKLDNMKEASDVSAESLAEQQAEVNSLNRTIENGEQIYKRAKEKVEDWSKQLNNAKAQVIQATKAVNENAAYLKEAEESWKGQAESIDEFGNKTDTAIDKLTEFKTALKMNVQNSVIEAGKSLIEDVVQTGVQGALELQEAQSQLQASTGATTKATKEYSKEMQDLYSSGYGESITDVAEAMELVKQYTNETNPEKIKEVAENAMVLQDVFDMDLSESIRGADALMNNMGVNAETAFNLIAKGAQNGLNKSGELTDNLAEYSSLWAQAGFSAEEMFAILENGLDSGAYNLDKVNDYVKEFGVSLTDGRIEQSLDAFSVDTQNLFREWQSGRATTKDVFQAVISDLSNMTNQQQALTIASNTWSSLGEDNAMKVITSLNNVNDTYKDVQGTMEDIKNTKYDTLSNQWKTLGRTFQKDIALPIIEKALPEAEKAIGFVADNLEECTTGVTAFAAVAGTAFAVKKGKEYAGMLKTVISAGKNLLSVKTAETVAEKASTAAKTEEMAVTVAGATATTSKTAATTAGTVATVAQTSATTAATVAQSALNAVMSMNPAVLLAAGIGTLVAALVVFGDQTEETVSKTDELAKSTEESIKKTEEATESLKESTGSWKESLAELETQEKLAGNLVTELYNLEGQSNKSSSELAQMSSIVDQLNSMFPELSLEIDKQTGALNKNEKQTRNSIEASLKYAKAQAAQEKMAEIAEELVDAKMAQIEADEKLSTVETRLNELDEERNRISEEQNKIFKESLGTKDAMVEYNGEIMHYLEALRLIGDEETELQKSYDKQEEALEDLTEEYNKANTEYEKTYKYAQKITDETGKQTDATQEDTDATNANTDALKANTDATNANAEASGNQQNVSKASIEAAEEETEAYRSLSAAQQDMAVNVTNAVLDMQESVSSVLESQMDLFEEFDKGTAIAKEDLLKNMREQVAGVEDWEENLSKLMDKGVNEGILQKLIDMGPQGSTYVEAFNSMTATELKEANELWQKSIDIKGMTDEWGQKLITSGAQSVAGGIEGLNSLLEESGANTVIGLVKGMQAAQKTAEAAGGDLGVKTVESINDGLGCHSPSVKTKLSGVNTGQGLILGMKSTEKLVGETAGAIGTAVVESVSKKLSKAKFETYGKNVTAGLVLGINSGKSDVVKAIENVCNSAIKAGKDTLEIHSPSHVFRGMANNTMDSYVLGVKDRMKTVQETVRSAVNFSGVSAKINPAGGSINETDYGLLQQAWIEAAKHINLTAYMDGKKVSRGLANLGVVFNG